METERLHSEERERIRQEERSDSEMIRQQERADERRPEDQRFQMFMMMMMMKPQPRSSSSSNEAPTSQLSQGSSQGMKGEFDGQDTVELELIRRTSGVSFDHFLFLEQFRTYVAYRNSSEISQNNTL